jgi:hypothetical protein
MKKIDFKHPRYVFPLIILPFIVILFYVYRHSSFSKANKPKDSVQLRPDLGEVSPDVSSSRMEDKFQASREKIKIGDGQTPLSAITDPDSASSEWAKQYRIDAMRASVLYPPVSKPSKGSAKVDESLASQRALAAALKELNTPPPVNSTSARPPADPMAIFRAQMAIVDSMGKANDPANRSAQNKKGIIGAALEQHTPREVLSVSLQKDSETVFNTVKPAPQNRKFIAAMVNEQLLVKGESRICLKLLQDIYAGDERIEKGTVLYALVRGFSTQRIQISVHSILHRGELLPVNLEVYDMDGIKGLYVPSSTFRDLSKELGSAGIQGTDLPLSHGQISSLLGRVFQSGSSALNRIILRNKAQVGYGSMLYLIDPDQLKRN